MGSAAAEDRAARRLPPRRPLRRARRCPPASGRRPRRAPRGPRRRPRPTSSRSGPPRVPSRSIAVQSTRSHAGLEAQLDRARPSSGPPPPSSRRCAPCRPSRRARRRAARRAPRPTGRDRGRRPFRARSGRRRPSSSACASSSDRIPPEACSRAGATASATSRTSSGRGRPLRAPSRSTRWIARGARLRERGGELHRVARPLDHLVVVSPVKAHGALAEHVDGRDHLDGRAEPLRQHATMLTC